jgi:hypothetical protein
LLSAYKFIQGSSNEECVMAVGIVESCKEDLVQEKRQHVNEELDASIDQEGVLVERKWLPDQRQKRVDNCVVSINE